MYLSHVFCNIHLSLCANDRMTYKAYTTMHRKITIRGYIHTHIRSHGTSNRFKSIWLKIGLDSSHETRT